MAAFARNIKARESDFVLFEKKRLPTHLNQSLDYIKMPFLTSDVEARTSALSCMMKKRLPACLNQNLCIL
jgi:hypothetical protein